MKSTPILRGLWLGGWVGAMVVLAAAHPSAGIVVDAGGRVFFDDLSRGLQRLDADGKVTKLDAEGGHWLALDEGGSFSRSDFTRSPHWPRWFKRKTPPGEKPALIIDGGSPIAVGPDGSLYFVCDDERLIPAGLQIGRVSPDGRESLVNPALRPLSEKLGGIKGLAVGSDGTLFASYPKAIMKIAPDGKITALANPLVAPECEPNVPPDDTPFLRGIAVDAGGGVVVAASGCGAVLRVTPVGKITTLLKAEKPWVPSGIFLRDGDLYVLEHVDGNSLQHEDWPPRIRKLDRNGRTVTLVDFAAAKPR